MVRKMKHSIVGAVDWKIVGNNKIEFLNNWDRNNLVDVFIPSLYGVNTYGGTFSGLVKWFAPCAEQLKAAWHTISINDLDKYVLFWGGSFNPRLIRGSKNKISNHALGIAFDINPQFNPLGSKPAPVNSAGTVIPLVPYFKIFNFKWGGDYIRRKDGMHFEITRRMSNDEIIDKFVGKNWLVIANNVIFYPRLIKGLNFIDLSELLRYVKEEFKFINDQVYIGDVRYNKYLFKFNNVLYTSIRDICSFLDIKFTVDNSSKVILLNL